MKLTTLREHQLLLEMGAKKACPVCGHGMSNFHFYRNGGWYCKTSSLSNPAPGADVAACKQALANGAAPRVSGSTTPTTPTKKPAQSVSAPPAVAPSTSAAAPVANLSSLQQKINKWLTDHNVTDFTINEDNSVSVAKSLSLIGLRYKKLPVKFRDIGGNVILTSSLLETLEGLPDTIPGELCLSNMENLVTLKGFPTNIGTLRFESVERITSLAPANIKSISNSLIITDAALDDLNGLPEKIGGDLIIEDCNGLSSLKGCPQIVGGSAVITLQKDMNGKLHRVDNLPVANGSINYNIPLASTVELPTELASGKSIRLDFGKAMIVGSVNLPDEVTGSLDLSSISTSAKIRWPSKVAQDLTLSAALWNDTPKLYKQLKHVGGTIRITDVQVRDKDRPGNTPSGFHVKWNLNALLGLTMFKGAKGIELFGYGSATKEIKHVQQILNQVISGDLDQFEAQEQLIDAGLNKEARF